MVHVCLDIVGAVFVAIEVVNVYKGRITSSVDGTWKDLGKPTSEYLEHEINKRNWMRIGLIFLLSGLILQILALWV